jgi:hypothetical protein
LIAQEARYVNKSTPPKDNFLDAGSPLGRLMSIQTAGFIRGKQTNNLGVS